MFVKSPPRAVTAAERGAEAPQKQNMRGLSGGGGGRTSPGGASTTDGAVSAGGLAHGLD